MPNSGNPVTPGNYSKRLDQAKKTVAQMDPAVKEKLKQYYPEVTKESIANKALAPKQGSQPDHHVTTVPPKPNVMNKSERDFEAGQKLKAKILKKTGVYPNTAD